MEKKILKEERNVQLYLNNFSQICVYFMSSLNMHKYLFGGEISGHGINLGGLAKVESVRLVFGHDTFERALSQLFYSTPHTPKLPF